MAKRLTPFIGLAVVAALALAAAFGAFSLSPAYAGSEAPNARGLAQPVDFQSQATALPAPAAPIIETVAATTNARTDLVAGTNRPANLRVAKGDTFTIDPATAVVYNADPVVADDQLDRYYVALQGNGVLDFGLDAGGDPIASIPPALASASSTEVTITARSVGVATVTILSEDIESNAAFVAGTGRTQHSTYTFSVVVVDNTLSLSGENPGSNTGQTVRFIAPADLVAGISEITIELEDFGFPGSTIPTAVGVSSDARYDADNNTRLDDAATPAQNTIARYNTDGTLNAPTGYSGGLVVPADLSISGEELTVTVPDMNPENDRGDNIKEGDLVTVLIRQGAGVSNPSEGGDYPAKITTSLDTPELTTNKVNVPRLVDLDETDGGRGTVVEATGKGFKNGTSLAFFRDANTNGLRDVGEVVLCDVARIGSDDTGKCSFTVSNPPFVVGTANYVGAVDGRGNTANKADDNMHSDQQFELTPTISAAPASGNPGDTILIQMYDFPPNSSVTRVDLARQQELAEAAGRTTTNTVMFTSVGVGADGSANFQMTVPNWAPEGVLDLKVTAGTKSDNITITIGGPEVTATPSTVLANQRINLVGSGFSPNSRVCCGDQEEGEVQDPEITIGGTEIMSAKINDGEDVTVDNGGNWSASINLPLIQATADEGTREIVVRDSKGRSGSVDVTIPARSVTIDPPVGRAGTIAIVRGENFPSKNDGGDSFNVEITYTAGSNNNVQVTTVPDASGRFEAEIRIPTSANIPSTNTVRVVYEDSNDVTVTTTVTHQVPEGALTLSQNSGPPDSEVTVRGEGFRASVPIQSVKLGDIEVTPTPRPSTSRQGGFEFDILIPGVDTGIQTLEVQVSGTTASVGFNVTDVAEAGAETAVATAVANLGENFVRAFYFDNISKTWSFYDPEVADASTMEYFIAGASYWVLVGQSQEGVILNRKTRNLYCGDEGNCWNLIVW